MTTAEIIARNFWTTAGNAGIFDHTTGLPELLGLLIGDDPRVQEMFADALEVKGFTVTRDQ